MASDESPGKVNVQIAELVLRSVHFERLDIPFVAGKVQTANVALQLGRPSEEKLNVSVTVDVEGEGIPFVAHISYIAQFLRTGEKQQDPDEEIKFWKAVAAQLGPVVAYPYIRDTLSSLTSRAGLPGIFLPIINFGSFINMDEIEVPAVGQTE